MSEEMPTATKVVCVTQSYDTLGNIDTAAYDLLKMGADNPFRQALEKALNNGGRVARLEMPEECWELAHPVSKEMSDAETKLPAMVIGHVHLRVAD